MAGRDTDDEAPSDESAGERASDGTASADGVTARYYETGAERVVEFAAAGRTAVVAQNREGYAMVVVRSAPDGAELERYYALDMALDHAAELLGVPPGVLPLPDAAADMGM